jgi:hypothetical protein
MNFSKASEKLSRGFNPIHMWDAVPPRTVYRHYTPHGAARLDRIYVTAKLTEEKVGEATVVAALKTTSLCVCVSSWMPHF